MKKKDIELIEMKNHADLTKLMYKLERGPMQNVAWLSKDNMRKYLSDDYVEHGSSGKIYKLSDYKFGNCELPNIDIEILNFNVNSLSNEIVLVTYKAIKHHTKKEKMKYSNRCSIWQVIKGEWKMIFHQGTLTEKIKSRQ